MYENILKLTFSSEVNATTKIKTKIETTIKTIVCSNNINEGITCC